MPKIARSDAASVTEALRQNEGIAAALTVPARGTRMGNESEQVIEVLFAEKWLVQQAITIFTH